MRSHQTELCEGMRETAEGKPLEAEGLEKRTGIEGHSEKEREKELDRHTD